MINLDSEIWRSDLMHSRMIYKNVVNRGSGWLWPKKMAKLLREIAKVIEHKHPPASSARS
jgi:hypothetical protein